MKALKFFISLILLATAVASAQIYINRPHRTEVIRQNLIDSMTFVPINKMQINFMGGDTMSVSILNIDSVSLDEAPDSLMRANLVYQDKYYSKYYPTYSDNYTNLSAWTNRSKWQLANVHDPTIMKAADGFFYMSQTDASYGNAHAGRGHYFLRRSQDLVDWKLVSTTNSIAFAMKESGPTWLLDSVNHFRELRGLSRVTSTGALGYWAPCIRKVNDNLYRMYYSVVLDNLPLGSSLDNSWPEPAWIGLLETNDPSKGNWVDKGGVICSASDKGPTAFSRNGTNDWNAYSRYNAIDPSYIITPEGEHWLIYGSWHSGIAALRLNPETGKPLTYPGNPWNIGTSQTTKYGKLIATRNKNSRWQGSEGAEVVYNPETGYYYLFLAYDGLDVPYNTRVVRSKNIDGPYLGMNGTNVTTSGGEAYPVVTHPYKFNSSENVDGWVGFSHCAVVSDAQGNWYYCSQARKPEGYMGNAYSNALMMGHVRRIYWTSTGWPVVSPERYAKVEQAPITRDDLLGKWEFINLTYSYGKQKTSQSLTVSAVDGDANKIKFSGALTATATYNPTSQILKVAGSGYELCVSRELDWEASPRHATIVFSGYANSGTTTYWAKKVE